MEKAGKAESGSDEEEEEEELAAGSSRRVAGSARGKSDSDPSSSSTASCLTPLSACGEVDGIDLVTRDPVKLR